MRSQLECRWAIFFDSLGIAWAYEPFPLGDKGKGWIPDFALLSEPVPTLAECKPAIHASQLQEAQAKAEGSGWVGRVVLLGADPRLVLVGDLDGTDHPHVWLPGHITTEGVVRVAPQNPFLKGLWVEAVNRTQWRARPSRRTAKP
jgi:hypothetical protein